jgi:hypothetical protein
MCLMKKEICCLNFTISIANTIAFKTMNAFNLFGFNFIFFKNVLVAFRSKKQKLKLEIQSKEIYGALECSSDWQGCSQMVSLTWNFIIQSLINTCSFNGAFAFGCDLLHQIINLWLRSKLLQTSWHPLTTHMERLFSETLLLLQEICAIKMWFSLHNEK